MVTPGAVQGGVQWEDGQGAESGLLTGSQAPLPNNFSRQKVGVPAHTIVRVWWDRGVWMTSKPVPSPGQVTPQPSSGSRQFPDRGRARASHLELNWGRSSLLQQPDHTFSQEAPSVWDWRPLLADTKHKTTRLG